MLVDSAPSAETHCRKSVESIERRADTRGIPLVLRDRRLLGKRSLTASGANEDWNEWDKDT